MSIGEVLAHARRRAGLSVTQVSGQTRIREAIIAGIEGDDYSACGGEFDARAYIRSIAAAVGADPGPLVEAYDAARLGPPARAEEVTEPLAAVPVPAHRGPGPVTPAGVGHRRPPAGPGAPARERRRLRRGPAWAVALGVAVAAGLGFAGYLLANTGHPAAPPATAPRAAPPHAGRASHAAPGTGRTQATAAPAASAPAGAPPRTLTPAGATAFGPSGGPGDNSDLARRAIDGNPATAWHTDWYATARFGNLYPGTGLLVDMGQPVTITAARVTLGRARGASFQLRVGATPAPASLRPAARAARASGVVRLQFPRPARGRYVLLWFTRLPPDPAGTFQVSVYSLHLEGRT